MAASTPNIGPREDYRTGVGDTTVGLMLGWHRPQLHSMTGINSYLYQQVTDDEIHGDPVGGDGRKLRVLAYGPQLVYRSERWGAVAKWQHEDHTRNKAEGDKYWLQLFFAL